MRKHYANRDSCELDEAGGYYMRHVMAMTSEGLHSKGAVAAELGHRDMVIDDLLAALEDVLRVGRGSSGRIILEADDETVIREAIASAKGGRA